MKQIKICAEYRDMLPRPRLDLSGTTGRRPIDLSPGSWQTSLGPGSMSRCSAQIIICLRNVLLLLVKHFNNQMVPQTAMIRGAFSNMAEL